MKNLNLIGNRKLIVISCLLLLSVGIFAQANFSGTWSLNESKSKFGDSQFRIAATTMTVTQAANNLTVESIMAGPDGEMKTSAKYSLDGQATENTGFMDMKSKSVVAWSADKTSIVISTTMSMDGNEFKTTQTWKLAENGKVLINDQSMPSQDGGEMKTTAAYDKK